MMDNNKIRIIESKNKFLVPEINGIPLHSIINPLKEAETLANNYMSQLSKNPNALVLGLGYGYHVEEIFKFMRLRHANPKIKIVEPSREIVRIFESYKTFKFDNQIFTNLTIDELYLNDDFLNFILDRPTVILNTASFKANQSYFQNMLTYFNKDKKKSLSEKLANLSSNMPNIMKLDIQALAQQIVGTNP